MIEGVIGYEKGRKIQKGKRETTEIQCAAVRSSRSCADDNGDFYLQNLCMGSKVIYLR